LTSQNKVAIPVPVATNNPSLPRSILHVDLDAFFVAVEVARRPELAGLPVIVGGDPKGRRGVVATASYEARKFGVHSAMPISTAVRLAPHAVYLRGDYGEYVRISRLFHAILQDYSPLVESGGLDEAYIDVTGCEPLVGTPQDAATTIRARIRGELGLAASVGIAPTKVVAKVASDKAKPDGVCNVLRGTEAAFLAPMPLRTLPMLGPSLEKKLSSLGVSTLGQVAALPDATLVALLGPHGAVVGHRARGIDPSTVGGGEWESKSISREGTFGSDVVDGAHLRAVLRGFSESVGASLRKSGRRARTVSLKLRYEDFTTLSRSVTPGQPLNSDDAIYAAADGLLTKARESARRPVRLIGVGLSNFVADAVQLSLEPGPSQKSESLSAAMDRVRTKYGSRSLQTGRTAFDKSLRDRDHDHVFDRNTGLSSQIG
jgi:DNA polymerase-4